MASHGYMASHAGYMVDLYAFSDVKRVCQLIKAAFVAGWFGTYIGTNLGKMNCKYASSVLCGCGYRHVLSSGLLDHIINA